VSNFDFRNQESVPEWVFNFQIDNWTTSEAHNRSLNDENKLYLSEIRPFGKWMQNYFSDSNLNFMGYGGIFSISKKDILLKPKSFYETFLRLLEKDSNPEVGHCIERAWEKIFSGLIHTKVILKHWGT